AQRRGTALLRAARAPGLARGGVHGAHPGCRGVQHPQRCGGHTMTTTQTRPAARRAMTANDGFGAQLRAEGTKGRSVRTTKWGAFLAVAPLGPFSLLWALGSSTNANEAGSQRVDSFRFTHQPLTGDGEIVAHLLS